MDTELSVTWTGTRFCCTVVWLVALVTLQEPSQKPGRQKPGATRQQQRMRTSHPVLRFKFHPVPYASAQVSWPAQATQSVVASEVQVLGEDPGTKESADAGFGYGMQEPAYSRRDLQGMRRSVALPGKEWYSRVGSGEGMVWAPCLSGQG